MTLPNLMQNSRFQTLWFDVYLSRQRSVPETQTWVSNVRPVEDTKSMQQRRWMSSDNFIAACRPSEKDTQQWQSDQSDEVASSCLHQNHTEREGTAPDPTFGGSSKNEPRSAARMEGPKNEFQLQCRMRQQLEIPTLSSTNFPAAKPVLLCLVEAWQTS